jgi:3-oxoadipate enol-lactonase
MPFADAGGLHVHYALEGPLDGELLVFSNSLGADLSMWEPQARALAGRYRVLRYDTRGHGRTAVAGPWSVEQLGRDVLGLLDALGLEGGHFCGLSLGGQVGMWLGAHAAGRVRRLALCNTAARIGTAETWNARIAAVQKGGMAAVTEVALQRWFRPGFAEWDPATVARTRRMLEGTPPAGYAGCCMALRESDQRDVLASIAAPTLVIAGRHDPATTAEEGRALAEAIPGARFTLLDTAHLSSLEAPESVATELARHLAD